MPIDSNTDGKLRIFFSCTDELARPWCSPFAIELCQQLIGRKVNFEATNWIEGGAALGKKVFKWSVEHARDSHVLVAFITKGFVEGIAFDELIAFFTDDKTDERYLVPIFLHRAAWENWTQKVTEDDKISGEIKKEIKERLYGKYFDENRPTVAISFRDEHGNPRSNIQKEIDYLAEDIEVFSKDLVGPGTDKDKPSIAEEEKPSVAIVFGRPDAALEDGADAQRDALVKQIEEVAKDRVTKLVDEWDANEFSSGQKTLENIEGRESHVVQVLDKSLANRWTDDRAIETVARHIKSDLKIASEPIFWMPSTIDHSAFKERARQGTSGHSLRHCSVDDIAKELKKRLGIGTDGELPLLLQDPGKKVQVIKWANTAFRKRIKWATPLEDSWSDSWPGYAELAESIENRSINNSSLILVAANDANMPVIDWNDHSKIKNALSEILRDCEDAIQEALENVKGGRRPVICRIAVVFVTANELDTSTMHIGDDVWSVLRLNEVGEGHELQVEEGDMDRFLARFEEAKEDAENAAARG